MSNPLFFDSLTHASRSGKWLDHDKFDASLSRLLSEAEQVKPYRACLVNIAGYSSNDELASIALDHPELFVPIAGFDPSRHSEPSEIDRAMEELADRQFAGVKLHPRLNNYDPMDERCFRAIVAAGKNDLVVFLDTLFRQRTHPIDHPANIIDRIAFACDDTRIVLLHGGASSMLDLYEIVRMRENLLIDTSFTLNRYAGSSLDDDMRFLFRTLDLRTTVGSDFPEYSLIETKERVTKLIDDLPAAKSENILSRNLERFLRIWLERRG